MDQLFIRNLKLMAHVGVHQHEKLARQELLVDIKLWMLPASYQHDDISRTLSYEAVAHRIADCVEKGHVQLVERLAEIMCCSVLELDPNIQAIEVTLNKPNALSNALSAGVTLTRSRREKL